MFSWFQFFFSKIENRIIKQKKIDATISTQIQFNLNIIPIA